MRVGVYNPIAKFVTCTLDGVDVTDQTHDACEGDSGWVEVYERDESGRILTGYDSSGHRQPKYEIKHGNVVLSLKPDAPPHYVKLYAALREFEREMGVV